MLSRIANGLFDLGQSVERAQHMAQIIEVNHKMNLERAIQDDAEVWRAISDVFDGHINHPTEREIYERFVLSEDHPYSVRHCVGRARFEGRAMREHISEEMWLHLNHTHLSFETLTFDSIRAVGRSEFNRRVTVFADALCGLADDTMIRGEAWAFLRMGKLSERAAMICQTLRVKESLITPERGAAPVDAHQWQALLRSLSGYEPYRRVYDARIVPRRVLEFVLKQENFSRSLAGCLIEMRRTIDVLAASTGGPRDLDLLVTRILETLRLTDPGELLTSGSFSIFLAELSELCHQMERAADRSFFATLRPPVDHDLEVRSIGAVVQQ